MKNLVEYSSSDSESEEDDCSVVLAKRMKKEDQLVEPKRNVKLPMLLSVAKAQETDSREDHQMRTRSIPHVEGNWATHVFIDCDKLNVNLNSVIETLKDTYEDIHAIETPHLSLSKTFILRYHWIDSFFETLKEKLKYSTPKFLLQLSSDVVYFSNEDQTRHFACILASEWNQQLLVSLVERVDSCLKEFDLPVYYENPSMHVSILWKLSEFTSEEKKAIEEEVKNLMKAHQQVLDVWIDKISCKSGNKQIEVPLQSN